MTVTELGDYVETFEEAYARDGVADLADFLPEREHPLFGPVLVELIRVDLDLGWLHGRPRPLQDYLRRFPELFAAANHLSDIAFEEHRLRRRAGENSLPAEYRARYGVNVSSWPVSQDKDG